MGIFDFGISPSLHQKSKARRKAKARKKRSEGLLGRYAPSIGSSKRSLSGQRLTRKQLRIVKKEKTRRAKKSHKAVKRIWRKLI